MARHHHRPKDAPPSTLKVLYYVALVWFAWGIFTRIDETEHLRPPPGLRAVGHYAQSALHDGERVVEDGLRGAWDGYEGLQRSDKGVYHLSFPSTPRSDVPTRGWFSTFFAALVKTLTYLVVYPAIAIFNAASYIIHYLSMTFLMLLTTAYYLSWPLHQLAGMIWTTCSAPMTLAYALVRFTEPLWTLAGGLLGAGATLGGTFAWLGNKAERRVYTAHEERRERRRVEELEREIQRREIELERERRRADEQERRNRSLQLASLHRRRHHRHPVPRRIQPIQKSLFAVLLDKVLGTHKTLQDEYDEYYADMELLEPPRAIQQVVTWDAGALGSGDEQPTYVTSGPRLLMPASEGAKQRTRRSQPPAVHHYRAHHDEDDEDAYIPTIHHHLQDDSLPPVHTPPTDGLPPAPRRAFRPRQPFAHAPQQQQQAFMTFPTGNLVRSGGTRTRAASAGPGPVGRRITFVDDHMMRARHEEDEPVEGEVFGLDDDEEGAVDDEDEEDAQPPAPGNAIHLHFHNNVPSNPVATKSSPASTRRKRTLRFQDDPDREHTPAPPPAAAAGPDHLGDKYGTPFKRSSTRLGKQAKHAFEDRREGDDGPAGMLFGQGDGGRRASGEVELDL